MIRSQIDERRVNRTEPVHASAQVKYRTNIVRRIGLIRTQNSMGEVLLPGNVRMKFSPARGHHKLVQAPT